MAEEPTLAPEVQALTNILECKPAAAEQLLEAAPRLKYYQGEYWTIRWIMSASENADTSSPADAMLALTGFSARNAAASDLASVLLDQSNFARRDFWGYRRMPLALDVPGYDVPFARSGTFALLEHPASAVERIDPRIPLGQCPA